MKPTPEQFLRTTLSVLVFFLLLLLITPVVLLMLIVSFGRLTNFIMKHVAPLLAKPVFYILGIEFSIKRHVDPLPSPAVYISNHGSTLDMFSILALGLPRIRFVAKWELQYNPLFFILGRLTGQIFIKRQNTEHAMQALKKAYNRIQKNRLSIFTAPEGSRKHDGIIGKFKKGAFHTAVDLGYPIVPIYFEGNQRLSKGGTLFSQSGKCIAHIHKPIDTTGWTHENLEPKVEAIRQQYITWAENDLKQSRQVAGTG